MSFGAYKMRIYLGSDEMPSPSENRQGRNARAASPAVAGRNGAARTRRFLGERRSSVPHRNARVMVPSRISRALARWAGTGLGFD